MVDTREIHQAPLLRELADARSRIRELEQARDELLHPMKEKDRILNLLSQRYGAQSAADELRRERDQALNLARHGACAVKAEVCKIAEAEARYWEQEAERCKKRGNQQMERDCRKKQEAVSAVREKLRSLDANDVVNRETR